MPILLLRQIKTIIICHDCDEEIKNVFYKKLFKKIVKTNCDFFIIIHIYNLKR